jgi:hypothetical protein
MWTVQRMKRAVFPTKKTWQRVRITQRGLAGNTYQRRQTVCCLFAPMNVGCRYIEREVKPVDQQLLIAHSAVSTSVVTEPEYTHVHPNGCQKMGANAWCHSFTVLLRCGGREGKT